MATWSATYGETKRAPRDKQKVRVAVTYTNGVDVDTQNHDVSSLDELERIIEANLSQYEVVDTILAEPPSGDFARPQPPEEPPPVVDPNAGLIEMEVGEMLTLLSEPSQARLRDNGNLAVIERAVLIQNRQSVRNLAVLMAARHEPDEPTSIGLITAEECAAIIEYTRRSQE